MSRTIDWSYDLLPTTPPARDIFASNLATARLDLTAEAADEAWAAGHALSEPEIVAYALRLA